MLITKLEERLEQYLTFFDRRKYKKILVLNFEMAETKKVYRIVPGGLHWERIVFPHKYGKKWTTYWFRTSFALPDEAEGREVYFHAVPNADSLVFVNGQPIAALNPFHEKVLLSGSGKAKAHFAIHLESYAGHKIPSSHPFADDMILLTVSRRIASYPNDFLFANLVVKENHIYDLYYDAFVLYDLAKQLDDNSLRKNKILHDLYTALMKIHFTADENELKRQILEAKTSIAPLMAAQNGDTIPKIYAVGHAHLDHAWLWPIWETERKCARTFANMVKYAEEFKDFVFLQPQPAQLEIIKKEYPAIFKKVKEAYKRGQWEPNGGMYVEADCNVTGGESLIRQFLIGIKITKELLGYQSDTLWLPDVFGYTACLPQILKGCEIDYFVTSKINWNDTTRFPYDTFIWKGIDGTGVKTHYLTSRIWGYNGKITPEHLFDAWNNLQHKEVQNGLVMSIGEGDGGGGTFRADLEIIKRVRNLEGCPKTSWCKVSDSLKQIFDESVGIPHWRGELYLELHRGTYTTQAKTKRYNRKLEYKLRENEFLASFCVPAVFGKLSSLLKAEKLADGISYPCNDFLLCWKKLLTNQFHDILPGTSIQKVYEDAEKSYLEIEKTLSAIEVRSRACLNELLDSSGEGIPFVFQNSLSWRRYSKAVIPIEQSISASSVFVQEKKSYPVQITTNIKDKKEVVTFVDVPSTGAEVYYLRHSSENSKSPFKYGGDKLITPFYEITFDRCKRITSLISMPSAKEYVKKRGALNTLQIAEDIPIACDAWDIDEDYIYKLRDEDTLVSSEVVSKGSLFIQLRNVFKIGECSQLVQDNIFYALDRRIDFNTRIDWQEDHKLLKVAFPVNIHSDRVKCEIQFGHLERNTHSNTLADKAQFEICAHKWVSMDDGTYGAAVLNDCKYGYDVNGSCIRLTLLKSSKAPDAQADMGIHFF